MYIWMPPSLSELTPILFNAELTHLGSYFHHPTMPHTLIPFKNFILKKTLCDILSVNYYIK